MSRILAALVIAFVSLPARTAAAEEAAPPPTELARREAALALIPVPWQELDYEIVFLAPRPGFRAMTIPGKRRIEIYLRPQDDIRQVAFDIAHELGHAIDIVHNTEETRRKWMVARGLDPATVWFGCSRCSDYNTPSGDFAETFALLLLGPEDFRGRIAPRPTSVDLQ